MGKINYAIVVASPEYRELIDSTLRNSDVMFTHPLDREDQKYLLHYIKENTTQISNYDALIIDLGALRDDEEQVMEAIEAIRYWDDNIRVIVLEGNREKGFTLLNRCFLNGIYNLIPAGDYIFTRDKLQKCLRSGMSYKEASLFRSIDEIRQPRSLKKQNLLMEQQRSVVFCGTQQRIGVTHSVICAAHSLRNSGYLTAVINCTESMDYQTISKNKYLKINDNGIFTLDEIDFYTTQSNETLQKAGAYNFILYDMGLYGDLCEEKQLIFQSANEKILLCGSKPWEQPALIKTLDELEDSRDDTKYLFNYTDSSLEREIRKMMKKRGLKENKVYFMNYLPDPFSSSNMFLKILGADGNIKHKKKWFQKKGDR